MVQLETVRTILRYNDWANQQLLAAAAPLAAAQLDRPFEMGVGSLRRTLIHIYNGEHVWFNRWQGRAETKWPPEDGMTVEDVGARLVEHRRERDAYLATLADGDLAEVVTYRDSKGPLFKASRGDMVLQACAHSAHHRAQAVNMLRHVAGAFVELDYMVWLRQPA